MAVTTRLGMDKPDSADLADPDVAISPQMDILESKVLVKTCTAATRPVDPFPGQLIYERDTRLLRSWDDPNTTWVTELNPVKPFGRVDFQSSTLAFPAVATNTEGGPFFSITHNFLKDRKYRFKYTVNVDITGASNQGGTKMQVRYEPGGSVSTTGTLVYWNWADMFDNGSGLSLTFSGFFTFTSVEDLRLTFGLFMARSASSLGTMLLNDGMHHTFSCEDVGGVIPT